MKTIATSALVVALAFVAQACCGGLTRDEADKTLRVALEKEELAAGQAQGPQAPASDANAAPAPPRERVCGAEVIARSDSGEEIQLEEVETEQGCEYVAEVDPFEVYTITARHPEHGGAEDPAGHSNPSCSTPTASEDIDNTVLLTPRPDRDLTPPKG